MNSESGYVKLDGADLYYEIRGQGPPLVLVNGWDFAMHQWQNQVEVFSRQHCLIRWDARGYGKTRLQAETAFSHAADLRALLDHLGIAQASFVGLSWGGKVVINFALSYPAYIEKLVLVAPALGGYRLQSDTFRRYAEESDAAYEAGDLASYVALDLGSWLAGPSRKREQVDPALWQQLQGWLDEACRADDPPDEEPLDPPAITRLDEIKAPALLIVGEHDHADFAHIVDLLAEKLPGAQKVVLADTAHVPHLERPERFNPLVLDFLAG